MEPLPIILAPRENSNLVCQREDGFVLDRYSGKYFDPQVDITFNPMRQSTVKALMQEGKTFKQAWRLAFLEFPRQYEVTNEEKQSISELCAWINGRELKKKYIQKN